jgi:hypothetical protein
MNGQVNIMPSVDQQQLASVNIGSTFESLLEINTFGNNKREKMSSALFENKQQQ